MHDGWPCDALHIRGTGAEETHPGRVQAPRCCCRSPVACWPTQQRSDGPILSLPAATAAAARVPVSSTDGGGGGSCTDGRQRRVRVRRAQRSCGKKRSESEDKGLRRLVLVCAAQSWCAGDALWRRCAMWRGHLGASVVRTVCASCAGTRLAGTRRSGRAKRR